jgi:hypothetical protein
MTLDEQLRALAPLPPSTIARLAGLTPQSLRNKRMRGSPLTADQAEAVGDELWELSLKALHMRAMMENLDEDHDGPGSRSDGRGAAFRVR